MEDTELDDASKNVGTGRNDTAIVDVAVMDFIMDIHSGLSETTLVADTDAASIKASIFIMVTSPL